MALRAAGASDTKGAEANLARAGGTTAAFARDAEPVASIGKRADAVVDGLHTRAAYAEFAQACGREGERTGGVFEASCGIEGRHQQIEADRGGVIGAWIAQIGEAGQIGRVRFCKVAEACVDSRIAIAGL